MTRRHIHYEAAFEDYLRSCGTPYLAVDENKKAIFAGARVKSFDFLVYRPGGVTWLVDVKGRKFPYDTQSNKRYWENWVTEADLEGLNKWQEVFGAGFESRLVFAYVLTNLDGRHPTTHLHPFDSNYYAFLCAPLAEYQAHCRPRSGRWHTLSVPAKVFREIAQPIQLIGANAAESRPIMAQRVN